LLGHQRSRDAATDDQRIAADILGQRLAHGALDTGKPWRAPAAQVSLLGVV
jgi:hypothetical protein